MVPKIPRLKRPLNDYPAQLLGSIELTVEEVLNIYLNFFTEKCTNMGVRKVIEILSSPAASTTSNWASDFKNSRFFGKTGTSNHGYDNWYVFYDSREIYVIWAVPC